MSSLIQLFYNTGVLFAACLFVFGVSTLFSRGYIFGKYGDWLIRVIPEWISKPLIGCPPCMSSVYGTLAYLFFINGTLTGWVVFCICLCGLNTIVLKFLIYLEDMVLAGAETETKEDE